MDLLTLAAAFVVILVGAELFTNSIEWLGHKLGLSEGAVGSVLAAVGTALPETTIPLIAILFSSGSSAHDVGIGAVLGAPFMLATLALFVAGGTVLLVAARKTVHGEMDVDRGHISTDLRAFAMAYVIVIAAGFAPAELGWPRWVAAAVVILLYLRYVRTHLTAEAEEGGAAPGPLRLHTLIRRIRDSGAQVADGAAGFGVPHPTLRLVVVQVVVALGAIVLGATLFVGAIDRLTASLGLDPTLLALLIAPMATELPEAVNGIIWIRRGKDGLALGNITGALVFQAAIPTSIALVFASDHWVINGTTIFAFLSAAVAFASTAIVFMPLLRGGRLNGRHLLVGGAFYVGYGALVVVHLAGWLG
jgi:cation:H+ antiporter